MSLPLDRHELKVLVPLHLLHRPVTQCLGNGCDNLMQRVVRVVHGNITLAVLRSGVHDGHQHAREVVNVNGRDDVVAVSNHGERLGAVPGRLEQRVKHALPIPEKHSRPHDIRLQHRLADVPLGEDDVLAGHVCFVVGVRLAVGRLLPRQELSLLAFCSGRCSFSVFAFLSLCRRLGTRLRPGHERRDADQDLVLVVVVPQKDFESRRHLARLSIELINDYIGSKKSFFHRGEVRLRDEPLDPFGLTVFRIGSRADHLTLLHLFGAALRQCRSHEQI
mmetsp:Transcript_22662/g.49163  ORF Transcript_22662/g.49163 Transcript_22662/m.49163 type:complete len:277 (-) Transcript_22662:18-848(-)